jgi:hypothetical protein
VKSNRYAQRLLSEYLLSRKIRVKGLLGVTDISQSARAKQTTLPHGF